MATRENKNSQSSSANGPSRDLGPQTRGRQTKGWGLTVSVLLHLLIGLCLVLWPVVPPSFVETPVTFVELMEPPSVKPDAGAAKDEGGGGGGQSGAESSPDPEPAQASEASATEPATQAQPDPQPEPVEQAVVKVAPVPQPTPTPVVEVAPDPVPQPVPVLPTPIRPRLAVLPAPSAIALAVTTPAPSPAPAPASAPGFLSLGATASANRNGQGSGSGSAGNSGSGIGSGNGTGSGSGTGTGGGSGRGTGNSSADGPGASCDMLERLRLAIRNTPQVQSAVADLSRNANAVGQALIIWDGEWIVTGGQDGRGLAGVRQAVAVTVAFAPLACKAEPVSGMVVIDLAEGPLTPRVALGKAQWRWNDLLETERVR